MAVTVSRNNIADDMAMKMLNMQAWQEVRAMSGSNIDMNKLSINISEEPGSAYLRVKMQYMDLTAGHNYNIVSAAPKGDHRALVTILVDMRREIERACIAV